MSYLEESVKTYPKTFSHIGITVPNIEEAVKFYTQVMGFYVIMAPTLVKEENETAIGQMCIDVFGEGWGTFKIAHLSSLGIPRTASHAKNPLIPSFFISWMQKACIFLAVSTSGGLNNWPFW